MDVHRHTHLHKNPMYSMLNNFNLKAKQSAHGTDRYSGAYNMEHAKGLR